MSKRPRRNHSPLFKAKVAVDAIKGEKTLAELSKLHDVHATRSSIGRTSCSNARPACSAPRRRHRRWT